MSWCPNKHKSAIPCLALTPPPAKQNYIVPETSLFGTYLCFSSSEFIRGSRLPLNVCLECKTLRQSPFDEHKPNQQWWWKCHDWGKSKCILCHCLATLSLVLSLIEAKANSIYTVSMLQSAWHWSWAYFCCSSACLISRTKHFHQRSSRFVHPTLDHLNVHTRFGMV